MANELRNIAPLNTHETRFADIAPSSYDREARTVDAVISMGSPVKRFYGTEVLRITPEAVVLARLTNGGIPVLDSHQQIGITNALGRVTDAWLKKGALMGRLSFNATDEGTKAEGMVSRGEIVGISAGYRVEEWEIAGKDGRIINPDRDRVSWDDDLTFTATRWELLEASLVSCPADATAMVRSLGTGRDRAVPPFVAARSEGWRRDLDDVERIKAGATSVTIRIGDKSITYGPPTYDGNVRGPGDPCLALNLKIAATNTLARMRARARAARLRART
jgi:hypothetical protein